jgi:hypothetical protein
MQARWAVEFFGGTYVLKGSIAAIKHAVADAPIELGGETDCIRAVGAAIFVKLDNGRIEVPSQGIAAR